MGKVSRIPTIGDYTIFFNSLFFVLYSELGQSGQQGASRGFGLSTSHREHSAILTLPVTAANAA